MSFCMHNACILILQIICETSSAQNCLAKMSVAHINAAVGYEAAPRSRELRLVSSVFLSLISSIGAIMSAKFIVVNNYKPLCGLVRISGMRRSSGGSVFGNPFGMKDQSLAERNRVCDLFEEHLQKVMNAKTGDLYEGLRRLYVLAKKSDASYIELACCCAPKRCHCDSIAAFLNSKLGI
jgi:hypothetical protein